MKFYVVKQQGFFFLSSNSDDPNIVYGPAREDEARQAMLDYRNGRTPTAPASGSGLKGTKERRLILE